MKDFYILIYNTVTVLCIETHVIVTCIMSNTFLSSELFCNYKKNSTMEDPLSLKQDNAL